MQTLLSLTLLFSNTVKEPLDRAAAAHKMAERKAGDDQWDMPGIGL